MDKAFLINYLNKTKQSDVTLECGMTKPQFMKSLIEAYALNEQQVSSSPDFMEMEKNKEDGKLYDLRRPTKETEKTTRMSSSTSSTTTKPDESEKPTEEKPQEPQKPTEEDKKSEDKNKDDNLKIFSDLGIKRVAFDDAFKSMNDLKYEQISDMFTRDEVDVILTTPLEKWANLTRKKLLARKKDLTTRVVVDCANEDISHISSESDNRSPEVFRNEIYGKVRLEYLKAFYKDAGEIVARHTNNEAYVGLVPARDESIKGLRLRAKKGRDRIVVLMEHPDWKGDKYLFLMGDKTYNFIFEPSSNALPMSKQEKAEAPKTKEQPAVTENPESASEPQPNTTQPQPQQQESNSQEQSSENTQSEEQFTEQEQEQEQGQLVGQN